MLSRPHPIHICYPTESVPHDVVSMSASFNCPSHCFFFWVLGRYPFSFSAKASIGQNAKSWHLFGDFAVASVISRPCLSHHIPFPVHRYTQYLQYCVMALPPHPLKPISWIHSRLHSLYFLPAGIPYIHPDKQRYCTGYRLQF